MEEQSPSSATTPSKPLKHGDDYPSPAYAWFTVFFLLVIYTVSFVDRQILSLLARPIMADFDIDKKQFGLLTGLAFVAFYATFGLFCARIADTKSRKGLIAVGLFLWSLMTTTSAFARSFFQLFLMRMGVGVGEAALAPAASSMIADSFPKERLGLALSVYTTGVPVGGGLAFIFGAYVIEWASHLPPIPAMGGEMMADWQKVFLLVGLPGILLAFLMIFLKEPSRKGLQHKAGQAVPLREVWNQYKKYAKAYNAAILGLAGAGTLSFGIISFIAIFTEDVHGIAASDMGKTYGIILMISGVTGLILGGWISDKLMAQGKKDAPLIAMMLAPLGYFIPSLAFPLVDNVTMMWVFLGIHSCFINLSTGVGYAAINIITPNEMRGQFTALFVMIVALLGAGLGPFLSGWFSTDFFTSDDGIRYAFVALSLLTTPLTILILQLGRKQFIQAQKDQ